jgi:predicted Zn-dependent protease
MTSRRSGVRIGAAWLLGVAVLGGLAACHDNVGVGACYEPNAVSYQFWLGTDSNMVFHWPSSYMPVRVYAEPTGALPTNVQNAMNLWMNAFRCRELALTLTTDSTQADIIVRNPPNLPAVARPHTYELGVDSANACTGVTQFTVNADSTALTGPMRSYVSPFPGVTDTAAVASCYHFVTAHELGHALGILAHSPDPNDLMFVSPFRLYLTADDRYTIQLLYHTAARLGPAPRP